MSDAQSTKSDPYRATLNLPTTTFAMKANLATKEPQIQGRWQQLGLYETLVQRESPRGPFVFHDGPPYANGPIHIGHLLNKILKDIVVRSRVMRGHCVDYVPGWDCHGLPIEHKVLKELGAEARNLSTIEVRKRCQEYAASYVQTQGQQMQRLGTLANYDHPYLTMAPAYEAGVLEVFSTLIERGLVYRDLKPVHWSVANRTALADAELEYMDRKDPSIYVLFHASLPKHGEAELMIWTTTPWTLPANLAVAVHPRGKYGVYDVELDGRRRKVVVVEELAEKVFALRGASHTKLDTLTGEQLVGTEYRHPFVERRGKVLPAEYVTFEDGTGLVHTAPGHGVEDYQTGLKNGLDIYCPVGPDGKYDGTVPEWLRGVDIWKANPQIIEHLKGLGQLFHHLEFSHSYPHDWRSKTPVIFRATEQWFIGVDKPFDADGKSASLRERAIAATENTIEFVPDWGKNRLRGMLEARPDWCISRQRAWGLPIPAFMTPDGKVLLTPMTVRTVATKIRENGSDAWFSLAPEQLLAGYDAKSDPHAPDWMKSNPPELVKGNDIFDVWFESGSSWNAVLRQRQIGYPAALYLEGSDQHRGWFQTSLLPALGATGRPPFQTLLTHGFMVDGSGHKMSKSAGNALEVDKLLQQFGADICRWWVSSLNYAHDIKVDLEYFKTASEEYRKVRNTLRFLLANLDGFDPAQRLPVSEHDMHGIDAWAMQELDALITAVQDGYDTYHFKKVREAVFNFCNDTLSAVYLAAIKDRLYCEAKDSPKRRRTQTVIYDIVDALVRILAPILVHTADEAYLELIRMPTEHATACVHTLVLPEPLGWPKNPAWDEVMALRHRALKALEDAKAGTGIANPLDAGITVKLSAKAHAALAPYGPELADLCGVSRFTLVAHDGAEVIGIDDLRNEPRCQRSWKRDGTVRQRSDGGMLSQRDAEVLGLQ